MTNLFQNLGRLGSDNRGSMVIETAIVAPVLVLMSIGGFEVSAMVARQHELQSGIAEAEAVALAANLGAETDTVKLQSMIEESLDLDQGQVTVTKVYRCDAGRELVSAASSCENYFGSSDSNSGGGNDAETVSEYVKLQVTDTYTPIWAHIGIGGKVTYKVDRMVQLS